MLTRCIADFSKYDMTYYLKGALAGGICCSFTHGALCPVDVVKTRMQLEPEVLVPRACPPPFTACFAICGLVGQWYLLGFIVGHRCTTRA